MQGRGAVRNGGSNTPNHWVLYTVGLWHSDSRIPELANKLPKYPLISMSVATIRSVQKTFFVQNFGCRATQADGAALEALLADKGLAPAAERAQADLVV